VINGATAIEVAVAIAIAITESSPPPSVGKDREKEKSTASLNTRLIGLPFAEENALTVSEVVPIMKC
jgi:hypothetical protein